MQIKHELRDRHPATAVSTLCQSICLMLDGPAKLPFASREKTAVRFCQRPRFFNERDVFDWWVDKFVI